jgi:hypothetical protein
MQGDLLRCEEFPAYCTCNYQYDMWHHFLFICVFIFCSGYRASNRLTGKQGTGQDLKRRGRGLISVIIPAFAWVTEESQETPGQDSRSPARNLNLGPSNQKAGAPTTRPRRSVRSDVMSA